MAESNRLIKAKQTNFLLSNFREFYKLWRDNQEAILRVKSCGGKLTINFESSFKVPEIRPTSPTKVNEKVKRISPSRRRRNMARAELFRRNKASKDTADGFPASSKESQEESQEDMQVSEASCESVSEKSPTSAAPSGSTISIPETSEQPSNLQHSQALTAPSTEDVKRDTEAEDEKFHDAEDWVPVSRVKSKRSELSRRIDRFQTEIRPDLAGKGPVKRQGPVTAKEWLDSCFSDLHKRISSGVDDEDLLSDIYHVSYFIEELTEGIESGGQPNLFDEYERRLQGLFASHANMALGVPRGVPVSAYRHRDSVVKSYKQSPSATFRKKK